MTAHAQRSAKREADYQRVQGMNSTFFGGQMWGYPRQQFQALYKKVGSLHEALRLAPDLIVWPPQADGTPFEGPPPHIIRMWTRAIDYGEQDISPKIQKLMDEKVTAARMSGLWRTLQITSKALETMAQKSADGNLPQPVQSQLLSLGNAFNYGMGSLAQMEKTMSANNGPTFNLTGRLSLNAGPPPPKRIKVMKEKPEQLVEGEYREVPADGGE